LFPEAADENLPAVKLHQRWASIFRIT
jgi:antitoxin Phd